jgi:hemerythrin
LDLLPMFDVMAEYARYHFGEEEALLSRHDYPETQAHRDRHASLMDQFMELRTQLAELGQVDHGNVLSFFQEWLVNHIVNEDRRYSHFLNERGIY